MSEERGHHLLYIYQACSSVFQWVLFTAEKFAFKKVKNIKNVWLLLIRIRKRGTVHCVTLLEVEYFNTTRITNGRVVWLTIQMLSVVWSGSGTNLKVGAVCRALPLPWTYKYTISLFGEHFRDCQYSLVSFLFAVLLMRCSRAQSFV